jgi:hypothetical protein
MMSCGKALPENAELERPVKRRPKVAAAKPLTAELGAAILGHRLRITARARYQRILQAAKPTRPTPMQENPVNYALGLGQPEHACMSPDDPLALCDSRQPGATGALR